MVIFCSKRLALIPLLYSSHPWYGPFMDYVQGLMAATTESTAGAFYRGAASFAWLALVGMNVSVINAFIVSHWIFRWRTAMNNYFMNYIGCTSRPSSPCDERTFGEAKFIVCTAKPGYDDLRLFWNDARTIRLRTA